MLRRQNGSMLVWGAGMIIVLTGFAVLAIDVGRVFIVRNELQNVADSAALAGANCLDRQSDPGSATECISAVATTLNWERATAKAGDQLSHNTADNIAISTTDSGHQVEVGYWNLGDPILGTPPGPSGSAFSTTFTPITTYDKPAVRVTVTKAAGMNGGPIAMLTAAMFGGANVPMTASAVAVISSPGGILPNSAVPQAINKCMYDKYWDFSTNSPKLATTTTLNGVPQVIGQPWVLRIGSSYHYDSCASGQWTSFNLDTNSASDMKILIDSGNLTELGIGDMAWIQPGTQNVGYKELDDKYPTPPGADVTVLVVDTNDLTNKGQAPIVAFAGFHISDVQGGSGKYMEGHFISHHITPGSVGIGPFYGTYTPPRLAQ